MTLSSPIHTGARVPDPDSRRPSLEPEPPAGRLPPLWENGGP